MSFFTDRKQPQKKSFFQERKTGDKPSFQEFKQEVEDIKVGQFEQPDPYANVLAAQGTRPGALLDFGPTPKTEIPSKAFSQLLKIPSDYYQKIQDSSATLEDFKGIDRSQIPTTAIENTFMQEASKFPAESNISKFLKPFTETIEQGRQTEPELVDVTLGDTTHSDREKGINLIRFGAELTDFEMRQKIKQETGKSYTQEEFENNKERISNEYRSATGKMLGSPKLITGEGNFLIPGAKQLREEQQALPKPLRIAAEVGTGALDTLGLVEEEALPTLAQGQSTFTLPEKLPFVGGSKVGAVQAGQLGTNLALMFAQYGAVNNFINSLPATSKVGQLVQGSKLAKFGVTQGTDLLADVIVQSPQEIMRAIETDQSLDEFGKTWLKNRAVDIAFNLAIGGAMEGVNLLTAKNAEIKSLKETMNSLGDEGVQVVTNKLKQLPTDQAQALAKELDIKLYDLTTGVRLNLTEDASTALRQEPASFYNSRVAQASDTSRPFVDQLDDIEIDNIRIPQGTPIDTATRITTELPRRASTPIRDRIDRLYQELVNQRQPAIQAGLSRPTASNLNRATGITEYMVTGKQVDMNGRELGDSVYDIFKDVPKSDKKALFDYSYNLHNIDRYQQGKPVFGETIDDVASQAKVNELLQSNPEFKEINDKIVQYFKNNLDEWGVKSGLIDAETANSLKELYGNYVPTYRVKDFPKSMGNESQNVSNVLKKAKGSDETILPLDQQMVMLTDKIVRNAKRNEAMNEIYSAYLNGEAGRGVIDVIDLPKSKINDVLEIGDDFEMPSVVKDKYALNFYVDGQPKQMIVEKNLFEAFNDARSGSFIDQLANGINKYGTKPFKELVTGKNPFFAASNIMRDIPTALMFSDNPLRLMKNVPKASKEILTNGDTYKLFKALGGSREGLIGSGKNVKIPNLNSSSDLAKIAKQVNKANPIKVFGDINNFTEQLPRFAEFISVYEKTGNPALAIYKSAELTTDFARFGKTTKSIDRVTPYLNASVQGVDRGVRQVLKNPLRTAVRGTALLGVPTLILDHFNKDNPLYNSLNPRERNMYYQIPFTDSNGVDKFIRIPKSREMGLLFSTAFEWAARKSRGQKVTGNEISEAIQETFKPASITENNIFTPAIKAWKQIEDPDAYQTNFWGGLIVPQSQRRYSPGEQYDANSSGIAKAIGQQFGVSPFVIDYLIDSYTGVVGDFVQPIGQDSSPDTGFTDIITESFEKKFTTDPVFRSSDLSEFYELLDKNKKAKDDYNKKNNIPSEVLTPLEEVYNAQNKVAREISALSKQFKELQTQNASDEQLRQLRETINKLAREAIEEFD